MPFRQSSPSSPPQRELPPHDVPDVWLKAAVLGSLWAAVEIIAGSFLHNVRIPFAGAALASAGVAILVSGQDHWRTKGLFWRAGVICALMKAVSPSAIILGPMIGIMTEALLLEGATRLLGMNPAGYVVGGALAVSWTLAQKVTNYVITFGADVVALYVRLYDTVAANLGITQVGPLDLVLAGFLLHAFAGAAVAGAAVAAVRRARHDDVPLSRATNVAAVATGGALSETDQRYSLWLLALSAAALVGGFLALRRAPLWAGLLYVAAAIAVARWRYPRALRRLMKPRLWAEIVIVMAFAGLLLGGARDASGAWHWEGLLVGVAMAARAVLVVVGFAVVAVELRNPRVVGWLMRRGMGSVSASLSIAFQALPELTTAMGEDPAMLRRPYRLLPRLIRRADAWMEDYKTSSPRELTVVLTGTSGSGTTSFADAIADVLRRKGSPVCGILAPGYWEGGQRSGFDVVELAHGRRGRLAFREANPKQGAVVPFSFDPEGLKLGRAALRPEAWPAGGVMFVDEVGPLELRGGGWADALDELTANRRGPLVLVVREALVDQVSARWLKRAPSVLRPDEASARELAEMLARQAETVRESESVA